MTAVSISTKSNGVGFGTNTNVACPALLANPAANDQILLFWACRDGGTTFVVTDPAGYTKQFDLSVGVMRLIMWRKLAPGGAETMPTITKTGTVTNASIAVWALVVSTVNTPNRFDVSPTALDSGTSATTSGPITGHTTSFNESRVFYVQVRDNDFTSASAPAGYTEEFDASTTLGSDLGLSMGHMVQTVAGATGNVSVTITGGVSTDNWIGCTFSVRTPNPATFLFRTPSESAPAADTVVSFVGRFRTASESAPAADTASRTIVPGGGATISRSGSETAPAVDTVTRLLSLPRAPPESAPASDTNTAVNVRARTASESSPAVDSRTATVTDARAGSESAPAADSRTSFVGRFRTAAESAPSVDTVARALVQSRPKAESAPAADTATAVNVRARAGSESAPAADSQTSAAGKARTGSESAPASDTAVRTAPKARSASESAPAADSVSRSLTEPRTASESAPAVDIAAAVVAGPVVVRPDSGIIDRPDTGTVSYAPGTIARPYSGTVAKPAGNIIERP